VDFWDKEVEENGKDKWQQEQWLRRNNLNIYICTFHGVLWDGIG
jgi:hypothetical protein